MKEILHPLTINTLPIVEYPGLCFVDFILFVFSICTEYRQYDAWQIEIVLHGHTLTDCQRTGRLAKGQQIQTVQDVLSQMRPSAQPQHVHIEVQVLAEGSPLIFLSSSRKESELKISELTYLGGLSGVGCQYKLNGVK